MVGISPSFFSVMDKNWLVYQPVLSVVDKYNWYFNRFCRSWTILGGIPTIFVHHIQHREIYQPILSTTDKTWR